MVRVGVLAEALPPEDRGRVQRIGAEMAGQLQVGFQPQFLSEAGADRGLGAEETGRAVDEFSRQAAQHPLAGPGLRHAVSPGIRGIDERGRVRPRKRGNTGKHKREGRPGQAAE